MYLNVLNAVKVKLPDAIIAGKLLPGLHVHHASSQVLIKMARVIVTLKIMPTEADTDLDSINEKVSKEIKKFGGEVGKFEIEEVAFGLKALKIYFVLDESKSNLDPLEEAIRGIEGVNSVDVIDVRRAIG